MFKKMRRLMFALSGSAAAILAVVLLRQRGTKISRPVGKDTLINVDEVPYTGEVQIDTAPASPPQPKKQASAIKPASAPVQKPDDLKRIEGIGPKTASILNQAGITSFKALADLKPEEIKAILRAAKGRGVPTSWPAQAKLAAAEDWDGLAKLQAELKGGR